MKTDETENKKGLLNTIRESFRGEGSCCPSMNSSCCPPASTSCCPESEAESKGKKDSAPEDTMPALKKRLDIEWKHFAIGQATCDRCGKTGEALKIAVEELRRELNPKGIMINFSETLLDKTRIAESNEILMNGVLLEDLLAATAVSTECPSCGTLVGESTCCRATEIGDNRYEDVPIWAIKNAAYNALGIEM